MNYWKDKLEFKQYIFDWAEKLDIKVTAIYLRPMKNKWASCSTKGHLNFNNELLKMNKKFGEYVILHELIHFRTPNHGKLWKTYMNIYLPGWKEIEKELKLYSTNKP